MTMLASGSRLLCELQATVDRLWLIVERTPALRLTIEGYFKNARSVILAGTETQL